MKQRLAHIRQLLDRYYDGRSSLQEEAELREFFGQADLSLPEEMLADAQLFCEMEGLHAAIDAQRTEEAKLRMPMGMEQRLRDTIVHLEQEEKRKLPARPQPSLPSAKETRQLKPPTLWWRIAACLIVVIGSGLYYQHLQASPFVDTCKTPEEAQIQMERALSIISHHAEQGAALLQEGLDKTNSPEETDLSRFLSFE